MASKLNQSDADIYYKITMHARRLTPTERYIYELLCEGKTVKEMATLHEVTTNCIYFHLKRMTRKYKVKKPKDLVNLLISREKNEFPCLN